MITMPVPPSIVIMSPSRSLWPPISSVRAVDVDRERLAAGDARLAHPARDDRRVRGHAAVRGQHARRPRSGRGCRPASSPSARGSTALARLARAPRPCPRRARSRRTPRRATRSGPCAATSTSAFGSIIGCSSWSSWAGSMRATASSREISPSSTMSTAALSAAAAVRFAAARLEQVEPLVLDRELDVLHVAVVLLEAAHRLRAARGRPAGSTSAHALDRLRRADAGDDVLALGVAQELAEEPRLARSTGRG